jgi:cellulose synthase/poly-beta-1,6-N-acetylglucosamine synthase-like glycosyltransferase
MILSALFILCGLVVVYSYGLYAGLVWVLSCVFGRRETPPALDDPHLPTVSLLIACHNEESVIRQRLLNALELDYPRDKLEIVIGSDGSSDYTADIVRSFEDRGVELLDYAQRRGKSAVLNASMDKLHGQIVVLSDANTFTDPAAVRNLVRWFADQSIGAVCGRLVLTDPATGGNVDSLYWRYETFLKKCESRLGALLGSNGAIYAIRRKLYVPIPQDTIVDDFVIPLLSRLRHGGRIIYDAQATAHEETAPDVVGEFRRRCRIGAGGFQAIGMLWKLLNPLRGWVALAFFSHKILRWLCPFSLIGLALLNILLLGRPIYRDIFCAQAAFYVICLIGWVAPGRSVPVRLLRVGAMFVAMNAALLVGFWRWLSDTQRGAWQRTARSSEITAAAANRDQRVGAIET